MRKIVTSTGSAYEISEHGICRKKNAAGRVVSAFKVFLLAKIPADVTSVEDVWKLEPSEPEVGSRMFVSGKDAWWISTEVVAITEEEEL